MRHGGTGTGYTHQGCRCDECRAAHTARIKRRQQERFREREVRTRGDGTPYLFAPRPTLPHGTVGTYTNWGCRCDPCVAANSARCAQWKQQKKRRRTG